MVRPLKEINWEIVEKRMEAGCTAREIAATVNLEINTFYDRFKIEFGTGFADAKDAYYCVGDSNIKFTQYMKALGGNIPMLMLLGRERLGQGKEFDTKPSNDELNTVKHENMLLRATLAGYREANADKSETG